MSALQPSSIFIGAAGLHNCLVMITTEGHSLLLASLTTSVTLAMLWLPSTSLITISSENPSDSQRSPSGTPPWSIKNTCHWGFSTLDLPCSLSWKSARLLPDSHSGRWSQSSIFSENKHKGVSAISHFTKPLLWTCLAGIGVHGPHISICGFFSLVTFFSP